MQTIINEKENMKKKGQEPDRRRKKRESTINHSSPARAQKREKRNGARGDEYKIDRLFFLLFSSSIGS